MLDIILSQCRSVSSLRSGEFKVSQAVILQCGGDGQSTVNTEHTSCFPPGGDVLCCVGDH